MNVKTILTLSIACAAVAAQAQQVTYFNRSGQTMNSWRAGDLVNVRIANNQYSRDFMVVVNYNGSGYNTIRSVRLAPYQVVTLPIQMGTFNPNVLGITTGYRTNNWGFFPIRTLWYQP